MKIALGRTTVHAEITHSYLVEARRMGFSRVELNQCEVATCDLEFTVQLSREYFTDAPEFVRAARTEISSGAIFVSIVEPETTRGVSKSQSIQRVAKFLLSANAAGVNVALQNCRSSPATLWQVAEQFTESPLQLVWDVVAGMRCGYSPFVAIPVLNSRLAAVRLTDIGQDGQLVAFGQGTLQARATIDRLRGIGYAGWIMIDPPPVREPMEVPGEWFTAARETIERWLLKPKVKTGAKPAAKIPTMKALT